MPELCGWAGEGAGSLPRLCVRTVVVLRAVSEGKHEFISSVVGHLPRVSLSPLKRTELSGLL